MLQCVACVAHCIPHMGECVAVSYSVLQLQYLTVLQCVAVCCSGLHVLQCVACVAHCIPHMGEGVAVAVFYCVEVCCSALHIVFRIWVSVCSALWCVPVCCSCSVLLCCRVLQCVAVCCTLYFAHGRVLARS